MSNEFRRIEFYSRNEGLYHALQNGMESNQNTMVLLV